MTDLAANVNFREPNDDGWTLDQSDECIVSVQAFWYHDRNALSIEIAGTTTVISPGDKKYAEREFQQNSRMQLNTQHWAVERFIFGIVDETHLVGDSVIFRVEGDADALRGVRRI